MKHTMFVLGAFIIASAIIWGVVILACSSKLSGTDCYKEIQTILGAGAGIHLVLIWGPLGALFMKTKKEDEK